MDAVEILQSPAALGAFVAALVEGIKRRYAIKGPATLLINAGLAFGLALLFGFLGLLPDAYPFPQGAALFGLYAALSATGLYEFVKAAKRGKGGSSGPGAGNTDVARARLR